MSPVALLELVLALLGAAIVMSLLAGRLALPPAAALVVGGIVLALIPGVPNLDLDPDLILVLFLPPLLLASAYFTVWRDFKADWQPIMTLAIGAVIFTTFSVGLIAHWIVPSLPWAACFALGAIVSPPDAVAAKAVLQRVPLPHRVLTVLEGESLVNDASGLVLYRFAVAAALTGTFSAQEAALSFVWLAIGGIAIGVAFSFVAEMFYRRLDDVHFIVVVSFLTAYGSYIAAEKMHASGVLAVVACGIVKGWRQHEVLDAQARVQANTVWSVVVFVLEALVFVLIGLSLRGVLTRLGSDWSVFADALPLALGVTAVVMISRLVWVFAAGAIPGLLFRTRYGEPVPTTKLSILIGWAGMRGVVSLAAALALPIDFPGRDLILFSSFAVIIVTVLVQGVTLGPLIARLDLPLRIGPVHESLTETQTRARVWEAALKTLEAMTDPQTGALLHPRLVEEYGARARATVRAIEHGELVSELRQAHFSTALYALSHSRQELIRMHRAGEIHDSVLHSVETDLDLEELRLQRLAAPVIGRVTRVSSHRLRKANQTHSQSAEKIGAP